jgi:pimeloyl-ACP methyl ester carboxylesterase
MNNAMEGKMQEHFWSVGGLRIHGYTAGANGPPVMLLHGGGIDSARLSWRCLIGPLSRTHHVVAFDWPGYGGSDAGTPCHHTLEACIALTGQMMDALGMPKASLIGISMGGGAALGFALQFPPRVDRLVLVDPYGIQRKAPFHTLSYGLVKLPWITGLSYAWLRGSRWAVRLSLKYILANPSMPDDEIVEEVFQAVQKPEAGKAFSDFQNDEISPKGLKSVFIDRIPELHMPVLMVHGEKDGLVPLACAREAQRMNPRIRLHVLPDSGHWPQRDWPERFNPVVLDFLTDQGST